MRTRTALCLLAAAASASCGTLLTRPGGPAFGGWPFAAVAADGELLSKCFGPNQTFFDVDFAGPVLLLGGLLSLPIDLGIDLLALPIDLVAWTAGNAKNVLHPYHRD